MVKRRKTDARPRQFYRSDRMVKENGKWFFFTREGTLEGPFYDVLEAEIQLEQYIKLMNSGLFSENDLQLEQADFANLP